MSLANPHQSRRTMSKPHELSHAFKSAKWTPWCCRNAQCPLHNPPPTFDFGFKLLVLPVHHLSIAGVTMQFLGPQNLGHPGLGAFIAAYFFFLRSINRTLCQCGHRSEKEKLPPATVFSLRLLQIRHQSQFQVSYTWRLGWKLFTVPDQLLCNKNAIEVARFTVPLIHGALNLLSNLHGLAKKKARDTSCQSLK